MLKGSVHPNYKHLPLVVSSHEASVVCIVLGFEISAMFASNKSNPIVSPLHCVIRRPRCQQVLFAAKQIVRMTNPSCKVQKNVFS